MDDPKLIFTKHHSSRFKTYRKYLIMQTPGGFICFGEMTSLIDRGSENQQKLGAGTDLHSILRNSKNLFLIISITSYLV